MSVFQISLKDTSHYPDIFTIRDTDKILTPEVEQRLEELTGHHPPSLQPIHSYAKVLDLSCKIFYHVYEYPPAIEGALMHYEVKLLPEATDFLSVYIRSTKIPTRPHAASLGYEVEVFVANYAPIRLPDGVNYSPLMRLSIDKEELPVVNWSCVMPEKPQREPLFYLDLSEVFTADADPAIKEQFATRIAEYYGRTMENLHEYLKDLRDAEGEPYAIYRPYLTLLPEEKLLQLCKVLIDLDNDTAL
ncbi:MAG: barstar family protein, partial [Chlamydiae bacterium]|nr:barstar family protein [Chlamydiota bacterium]